MKDGFRPGLSCGREFPVELGISWNANAPRAFQACFAEHANYGRMPQRWCGSIFVLANSAAVGEESPSLSLGRREEVVPQSGNPSSSCMSPRLTPVGRYSSMVTLTMLGLGDGLGSRSDGDPRLGFLIYCLPLLNLALTYCRRARKSTSGLNLYLCLLSVY